MQNRMSATQNTNRKLSPLKVMSAIAVSGPKTAPTV